MPTASIITAYIIHLGMGGFHRISVLESAEYFVSSCKSFAQLRAALTGVPTDCDLIVPALANRREWTAEVQILNEESCAIPARSEAIREASSQLRQQSLRLREECVAVREKLRLECQRSQAESERNR